MFKIAGEAWKMSLSKNFFKWMFGSASTALCIVLASKTLKIVPEDATWIQIVFYSSLLFLGICVVRFIYFFCKLSFVHVNEYLRERMYGEILVELHDVYSIANKMQRDGDVSDEEFMKLLVMVCERLKLIFGRIEKKIFSISIKLATSSDVNANTTVVNLCRDKKSNTRDTVAYNAAEHFIFKNTCYNYIITKLTNSKRDTHYLNNNIPSDKHYENTSRNCIEGGILPYKSELVVPIIPLIRKKTSLVGFLCIDCEYIDAFRGKYIINIVEGVADSIYDVMKLKHQNQTQKVQQAAKA